jgi:Tfp pilus assembly protein PilF
MRVGGRGTSNAHVATTTGTRWPVIARRTCARLGMLAVVLALGACALQPVAPEAAPKVEGLPELMHQAETAAAAGDKDKARDAYRAAAKADPTSKLPWVKLAESYFEAGDYGNAVLAGQEVLHRDNTDSVAAGILAVSGLRVSTSALATLRQQNNIAAGTRGEAETLARNLRELLGEPVLVPRPASETNSTGARPRARSAAAANAAAASAASSKPAATAATTAPAAATASRSGNPFDKLK